MKEKMINGKKVFYAESAREMRSQLAEYPTQLMAQSGAAVAICTADEAHGHVSVYCDFMERSHNYTSFPDYQKRKEFLRQSDLRVLISHRTDNGLYSLIGGARKLTESFEETAFREVGEESGLEINDMLPLGTVSGGDEMINIYPDGNAAEGIDALYFALVQKGAVARPNQETREFVWMTPDEIFDQLSAGHWHPAQVKTARLLLRQLMQLPELYRLHQAQEKLNW